MIRRVTLAVCCSALLPVSAASAAQITTDRACYLAGQPMVVGVTGFAPTTSLTLTGDGLSSLGATTDASGAFQGKVAAPRLGLTGPALADLTLKVTDPVTGAEASTLVNVTLFAFATDQGRKSPKDNRTWRFTGFFLRPGKPIYGHFRFRGRTYANYRFGTPSGPCGTLTKRAPGIPARRVRAGAWTIQIDQNKTYRPNEKIALKVKSQVVLRRIG